MKCPECGEIIEYLNYSARYSERVYGSSNGSYIIDDEYHECDNQDSNDSEDFEEYDYEYECPECSAGVYIEDLLDDDEEMEEESSNTDLNVAIKSIFNNL